MISPFVSIIIPTYNDWFRASLCLNSLSVQTFPADKFEIIVVNNNPKDHIPADLILPSNCTVIDETKPGSYAARNAALRIAKGEIIGFTDSDCIADKDWIKNAVLRFSDPTVQRIGGAIKIFFTNKNPSMVELHDKVFAFPQESYIQKGRAVTGNMFSRKVVFDQIGLFNDTILSGGDLQWGTLANDNGYPIVFAPDVIINHPARPSLHELIKKQKRVGKGQAGMNGKVKTNYLKLAYELVQAGKPRFWEIRIIFKHQDLKFLDKLYVVGLRYYIVYVGNVYRIINSHK